MDDTRKKTIIIRGATTAVLFAAGFAFPLIWIVAAFFAYTTYSAFPDPEPVTPENMYKPRQSTVTVDDREWREYFLDSCESPAETAFLEAMITGYGLVPDNGILIAPGIELDMQTEYKPYRLDFLVNKWLVVEIDGAAWHSLPEAVERDGTRDEFFVAKGFSVLRIPAKTVFQTPTKAVEMVRAAIARGRPVQEVVVQSRPISVAKTFTNSMRAFGEFMDSTNAYVTKAVALQKALEAPELTFHMEKLVIDSALERAKKSLALKEELAANPNLRKHYEANLVRASAVIDGVKAKYGRQEVAKISIEPISPPEAHPDTDINDAILRSFSNLMDERSRYFDVVREQLSKDSRLYLEVLVDLEGCGCGQTFSEIMKLNKKVDYAQFFADFGGRVRGNPRSETPPN